MPHLSIWNISLVLVVQSGPIQGKLSMLGVVCTAMLLGASLIRKFPIYSLIERGAGESRQQLSHIACSLVTLLRFAAQEFCNVTPKPCNTPTTTCWEDGGHLTTVHLFLIRTSKWVLVLWIRSGHSKAHELHPGHENFPLNPSTAPCPWLNNKPDKLFSLVHTHQCRCSIQM